MNKIQIETIKVESNRIDIFFTTTAGIDKYFSEENHFWVEYSIPCDETPIGIALIPFVCNILPIIWITDSELVLPEIDKSFFDSIENFKKGYIDMYPMIKFAGKVSVDKLVDIKNSDSNKSALLFSGGVDAYSSLVGLINEQPELVTVWGSDISPSNVSAWSKVDTHIKDVSEEFDLEYRVIKSNFRTFIKEGELSTLVLQSGDGYWHGFQHGIGLLGLAAPYTFQVGIKSLYISSSFTEQVKKNSFESTNKAITCASDPSIDNFVKFSATSVIHYQYDMDRQMKIENIHKYAMQGKHQILLRVCWQSINGDNCCKCEKCYRTICGLWAEGANPSDYGFNIDSRFMYHLLRDLKTKGYLTFRWEIIRNRFIENKENVKEYEFMAWFIKSDFNKINNSFSRKIDRSLKRISAGVKNRLKRVLRFK